METRILPECWGSFGYTGSTGTQGVIGFTGSGSTGYVGSQGVRGYTGSSSGGAASAGNITLYQSGNLSATIGTTRWYAPNDLQVNSVKAHVMTAGADATVLSINVNDSPITNITIDGAATTSTTYTTPFSLLEEDYITVDVTPVNPALTLANGLYVMFKYQSI